MSADPGLDVDNSGAWFLDACLRRSLSSVGISF